MPLSPVRRAFVEEAAHRRRPVPFAPRTHEIHQEGDTGRSGNINWRGLGGARINWEFVFRRCCADDENDI